MKNDVFDKILLMIKLDSESLYHRIVYRKDDYLRTMVLKRTREHLKQVFRSRYYELKMEELKEFSSEAIVAMENFYRITEDLGWYLFHTEDMPATIEDKISYQYKAIEKAYEVLNDCLNDPCKTDGFQESNEFDGPPEIKYSK